ncbi:MAG: hypothetical protein WDO15_24830 [Bacteroidota bacterium]
MKTIIVSIIAVFFSTTAFTQTGLRFNQFNLEDGVAIEGYDPGCLFHTKEGP